MKELIDVHFPAATRIQWMFATAAARTKMGKAYPATAEATDEVVATA